MPFAQTVLGDFFKDGDAMYAQFKQESATEVTMRSFLQIAWSSSRSWLQPERECAIHDPRQPTMKATLSP